MKIARLYLCSLWLSSALYGCNAAGLTIALHFDKDVYQIGDTLNCFITFKNTSSHPIRFLPIDVWVDAGELDFHSKISSQPAILITRGERYYDDEALSKKTIVLKPGDEFTRQIKATVRGSLPVEYNVRREGLVLDFGLSAVVLPGFGKYVAVKSFEQHSDSVVFQYLPKRPPFWDGVVASSPTDVEFRSGH